MQLAIIIVSWNVADLLKNCLESAQTEIEAAGLTARIWVVDNASQDGSAAMVREQFPQVSLIASEKNLGFSGGNNMALRAMGFPNQQEDQPEVVLLLNPDTIVQPGALRELVSFFREYPKAGIAGARLSFEDGSFQHGAFAFPGLWQLAIELLPMPGRLYETRLNGRYDRALYDGQAPFPIDHPLGAALLVRREALWQVGLLDEAYHMYVEEVDLCKRIKTAGWTAYCVPTAHVIHLAGQSTAQIQSESFVNLWRSRYQFYAKYYPGLKTRLATHLVKWRMTRNIKSLPEQADTFRRVQQIWQGQQV